VATAEGAAARARPCTAYIYHIMNLYGIQIQVDDSFGRLNVFPKSHTVVGTKCPRLVSALRQIILYEAKKNRNNKKNYF
jgi:hypothetical protein